MVLILNHKPGLAVARFDEDVLLRKSSPAVEELSQQNGPKQVVQAISPPLLTMGTRDFPASKCPLP